MARYLSREWFAASGPAGSGTGAADVVLEQVVVGSPDGTVAYRVEVTGHQARLVWPVGADAPAPDLRITTDWETAVAVARGDLSTQRALMQGRLRVSGSPARLSGVTAGLAGVDAVPPGVREATTYE